MILMTTPIPDVISMILASIRMFPLTILWIASYTNIPVKIQIMRTDKRAPITSAEQKEIYHHLYYIFLTNSFEHLKYEIHTPSNILAMWGKICQSVVIWILVEM